MCKIKFRQLFSAVLFGGLLSSCASWQGAGSAPQPIRLYVFNCGTIDVLDISRFNPAATKGEHKTLTNSCYLVVHPKGTLMWDTGLPDELADMPGGSTMPDAFVKSVTHTLASQLQEIGYDPDKISYLGLSHMHGDHTGNTHLFPHATLLLQMEEYAAAFGPDPDKVGFDPTNYPTLHANPVRTLQGDFDVFGDGTAIIKSTPGHSPGHQSLYLKLAKSGNILLSGDLVHFTSNWQNKVVPAFNFDQQASLQTMLETEQFLKKNNAVLWIQHDREQNAGIRHAPAYYE